VTVWVGETPHRHQVSDYPKVLPRILGEWRLDPSVTRIEIDGQSLEDVVLDLVGRPEVGSDDG
jgi:hypothetical protein